MSSRRRSAPGSIDPARLAIVDSLMASVAEEIFTYLSIPENEFPKAHVGFDQPIMTRESFHALAEKFRSPHLWKKEGNKWKLRHVIWEESP